MMSIYLNNRLMADKIFSKRQLTWCISNESAMMDFGAQLAKIIAAGTVVFLEGDLGAGKTTFVRGFLRQLGYNGAVKSPTFTLVETYLINNQKFTQQNIYHFDLYRLSDPEELDYIGLSDYMDGQAIVLIEWPDKGTGYLPQADLLIQIKHFAKQRQIEISSTTDKGIPLIAIMDNDIFTKIET